jgi:DNA adenine methylase
MRKPFLKWAGNKYRVLPHLLPLIGNPRTFVEPFAGSVSVSLNVDANHYVINDINPDLVSIYRELTNSNSDEFIAYCGELFTPENNTKDAYLEMRELFNSSTNTTERARLFVYLNRHCFNGLSRYNKSGGFNVPFGKMKNPQLPYKEMMSFRMFFLCSSHSFHNTSFDDDTLYENLSKDDVVYFDPPYVPLTETSNFTSYSTDGFAYTQQEKLVEIAERLSSQNVRVIISNHDTDVSRELYKNAKIHTIEVRRNISAKGTSRNKVKELIAVY